VGEAYSLGRKLKKRETANFEIIIAAAERWNIVAECLKTRGNILSEHKEGASANKQKT
jgi:hypothetical protein